MLRRIQKQKVEILHLNHKHTPPLTNKHKTVNEIERQNDRNRIHCRKHKMAERRKKKSEKKTVKVTSCRTRLDN